MNEIEPIVILQEIHPINYQEVPSCFDAELSIHVIYGNLCARLVQESDTTSTPTTPSFKQRSAVHPGVSKTSLPVQTLSWVGILGTNFC